MHLLDVERSNTVLDRGGHGVLVSLQEEKDGSRVDDSRVYGSRVGSVLWSLSGGDTEDSEVQVVGERCNRKPTPRRCRGTA